MPNITISGLPPATLPLDDPNTLFEVSVLEAGEEVSRKITLSEIAGATGLDASFLTLSVNAQLPNERVLTAGTNIAFVDTGPNGTLTINATGISFPLLAPDGSAVAPSYSFTNDTGAGMFLNALGELSLAADGVEILRAINGVNNQVAVAQSGSSSVPDFTSIADLDTGFRFPANNETVWIGGGSRSWNFSTAKFFSQFSNGPALMNEISSATNPTVVPDHSDADTGLGHTPSSDQLTVIAGGVEVARAIESGGVPQFIIPLVNAVATPTLAFGDGDSGFFQPLDDNIQVSLVGVARFFWELDGFNAAAGTGPSMRNEVPSATNPVFVPRRSEPNTGLGWNASGEPSLIGLGVELARGVTAATGGLFANNTFTGAGLERVLTTSDAFAGIAFPILAPDGSAAAPSYSFAADTDIGMFRVGADILSFSARATEMLQVVGALGANQVIVAPGVIQNNLSAPDIGLGDGDTGIMQTVDNTLAIVTGATQAVRYEEASAGIIQSNSNQVGLTASVTQTQAGGLALLSSYNEIATVANSGDALTAFDVFEGHRLIVVNNGINQLQLFPAVGDNIGEGVDLAVNIEVGHVAVFLGRDSTNWDVLFNANPNIVSSGGATISGVWQFDSNTTEADPGAGNFRNDNATIGSVTEIFISSETKAGFDADNILGLLQSGDQIYLQDNEDAASFLLFDITANVDNGGWFSLAGTVNLSGTNFTDGKEFGILLLFGGGVIPGTTTNSMLRFDGSSFIEETQVQTTAAGVFSVFDAGLTDSISVSHNGSTGLINTTGSSEVIFGLTSGPTLAWRYQQMVRVPDGSAAVPGITWFGDAATGIFRQALGLSVSITGVEQARFSNATTQIFSDDLRLQPDIGADFVRFIVDGPSNPGDFEIETTSLTDIHVEGVGGERFVLEQFNLAMEEKAAAPGDVAGVGQFWVRDDAPNTAMFTTDTGVDKQLINDAVQARRTTNLTLTTAFVDVTLDVTDIETDVAVLDHDLATNSDNIIAGVAGTYRIHYGVKGDPTITTNRNMLLNGRVRLNDAGTGILGSVASTGFFNDSSIDGEAVPNRLDITFYVTLAAADFITLQVSKTEISGSDTDNANQITFTAERVL